MKLLLTAPNNNRKLFAKGLIQGWLQYNDVFVRYQDLEVSYNDVHNFWDISIFKDARALVGNGTKEWRAKRWEEQKQVLTSLFNSSRNMYTWKWAKYCNLECSSDDEQIPGIRMFVWCEKENN